MIIFLRNSFKYHTRTTCDVIVFNEMLIVIHIRECFCHKQIKQHIKYDFGFRFIHRTSYRLVHTEEKERELREMLLIV